LRAKEKARAGFIAYRQEELEGSRALRRARERL
jgi:hypothetical protein